MKKQHYSAIKAEQLIRRSIRELQQVFAAGKALREKAEQSILACQVLDDNNPDFNDIRVDYRERNKMIWRLLLIILGFIIDYFLLINAMTILCSTLKLPEFLKIAVPSILIVLEVGISYLSLPTGQYTSIKGHKGIARYLPYFVIVMLVGLSALVIFFAFSNYSHSVEGFSFVGFLTGTVITQGILLVASIMLHAWCIWHSEEIAETFAFWRYVTDHGSITTKITRTRQSSLNLSNDFTDRTISLVQNIEMFKRSHPDISIDFSSTMPLDLLQAINRVMGKEIHTITGGSRYTETITEPVKLAS